MLGIDFVLAGAPVIELKKIQDVLAVVQTDVHFNLIAFALLIDFSKSVWSVFKDAPLKGNVPFFATEMRSVIKETQLAYFKFQSALLDHFVEFLMECDRSGASLTDQERKQCKAIAAYFIRAKKEVSQFADQVAEMSARSKVITDSTFLRLIDAVFMKRDMDKMHEYTRRLNDR